MLNYRPSKVAKWEVKAWQAHHYGNKYRLAYYLMRQHMELFSIHSWQAIKAMRLLVPAIRAHNYIKKDAAEKHLQKYYGLIKQYTHYSYDIKLVAHHEAAWWWVHDELEHKTDKSKLILAFAELYGAILSVPITTTMKTGELRTQATVYHDLAENKYAPADKVTGYWQQTEQNLMEFYTELLRVDHAKNFE